MSNRFSQTTKGQSQRQLRAGELVRQALAEILLRGEVHGADIPSDPVTVSEVKVSPDLRAATAYVSVLGKDKFDAEIALLNKASPAIRHALAGKIEMKFVPAVTFRPDESFQEAAKIHRLLKERPEDG